MSWTPYLSRMIKDKIVAGEIYHIYNKSVDNISIFMNTPQALRFLYVSDHYNDIYQVKKFSQVSQEYEEYNTLTLLCPRDNRCGKYISYCVMPNHYHFLIKIYNSSYFSRFLSNVENIFTRFFNAKHDRKGPLWQSRFQAVRIKTNQQLLHVSRYIHLNPVVSNLVVKPEDWRFSSYRDIIYNKKVLRYLSEISIQQPLTYKQFVEDRIDYQRRLKYIKRMIIG